MRALRNSGTDDFGRLQLELLEKLDQGEIDRQEAQQQVEAFWMGRLREAVQDGDIQYGSLMAGQSVGLVDRIMPVQAIIAELVAETELELQRIIELLG